MGQAWEIGLLVICYALVPLAMPSLLVCIRSTRGRMAGGCVGGGADHTNFGDEPLSVPPRRRAAFVMAIEACGRGMRSSSAGPLWIGRSFIDEMRADSCCWRSSAGRNTTWSCSTSGSSWAAVGNCRPCSPAEDRRSSAGAP